MFLHFGGFGGCFVVLQGSGKADGMRDRPCSRSPVQSDSQLIALEPKNSGRGEDRLGFDFVA